MLLLSEVCSKVGWVLDREVEERPVCGWFCQSIVILLVNFCLGEEMGLTENNKNIALACYLSVLYFQAPPPPSSEPKKLSGEELKHLQRYLKKSSCIQRFT